MKEKTVSFFKKLSLIDIAVFFVIAFALGVVLIFFANKKDTQIFVELTSASQDWQENPLPPDYWKINDIKEGDLVYNGIGNEVARVTSVVKDDWGGLRQRIKLTLLLTTDYDKRTRLYIFNSQPIVIGQELVLNINQTKFKGVVVDFYKDNNERKQKTDEKKAIVKIKFRELDPWHAEAASKVNIKNSDGEQLLTVKEAKILPAEMIVETAQGDVFKRYNPLKKDLEITAELEKVRCSEIGCVFYDFIPLKIGSFFWIHSQETYLADGSIMSFEIID